MFTKRENGFHKVFTVEYWKKIFQYHDLIFLLEEDFYIQMPYVFLQCHKNFFQLVFTCLKQQ